MALILERDGWRGSEGSCGSRIGAEEEEEEWRMGFGQKAGAGMHQEEECHKPHVDLC